ncbi:hypothetical protein AAG570_002244 [Ranatra chinensis]|uniref:Uncharacterized protein n=1 Tax=Ranatra chinensis TaxID=642074 RepID=A0ABD0YL50_9HEMI
MLKHVGFRLTSLSESADGVPADNVHVNAGCRLSLKMLPRWQAKRWNPHSSQRGTLRKTQHFYLKMLLELLKIEDIYQITIGLCVVNTTEYQKWWNGCSGVVLAVSSGGMYIYRGRAYPDRSYTAATTAPPHTAMHSLTMTVIVLSSLFVYLLPYTLLREATHEEITSPTAFKSLKGWIEEDRERIGELFKFFLKGLLDCGNSVGKVAGVRPCQRNDLAEFSALGLRVFQFGKLLFLSSASRKVMIFSQDDDECMMQSEELGDETKPAWAVDGRALRGLDQPLLPDIPGYVPVYIQHGDEPPDVEAIYQAAALKSLPRIVPGLAPPIEHQDGDVEEGLSSTLVTQPVTSQETPVDSKDVEDLPGKRPPSEEDHHQEPE